GARSGPRVRGRPHRGHARGGRRAGRRAPAAHRGRSGRPSEARRPSLTRAQSPKVARSTIAPCPAARATASLPSLRHPHAKEIRMLRALGIAGLLIAMAVGPARAEDPYPTRPISMVVAFPPGGLADNTARPVATALERILKQPVAIINKAGAAGAVGNQTVATSKPDGYTLLMALVSISVLPEVDKLFGRPPNYTRDQFTGIARINADHSMLVVRADAPWKTLKDL